MGFAVGAIEKKESWATYLLWMKKKGFKCVFTLIESSRFSSVNSNNTNHFDPLDLGKTQNVFQASVLFPLPPLSEIGSFESVF